MRIEFRNGATVHAEWKGCKSGDLIAAFVYFTDAEIFAKVYLPTKPKEVSLVIVDHCTGKTLHLHHEEATESPSVPPGLSKAGER